jgi:hypothetical protein
MCDEWFNGPELFIAWALENGWKKGLEIDKDIKADKLGGDGLIYSPEWCSVVTPKENGNNTRRSRKMEYNGVIQTSAQWSEHFGVSKATFWYRVKKCNFDMYAYAKRWNE